MSEREGEEVLLIVVVLYHFSRKMKKRKENRSRASGKNWMMDGVVENTKKLVQIKK